MEREHPHHLHHSISNWGELFNSAEAEQALSILDSFVSSIGLESLTVYENQEQRLQALRSALGDNSLCLVLGAGVSIDYGIPCWYQLLQRLLIATVTDHPQQSDRFVADTYSHLYSPDPLVTARYLKSRLKDESAFAASVRRALYASFREDFTSPLMRGIIELCRSATGTPSVSSVITYNYDDILERHLDEADPAIEYNIISEAQHRSQAKRLQIYHVHGFLPSRGDHRQFEQITFSEDEYHRQYYDSFTWSNIVQINLFREQSCLFLGSSLTDPDTRRLLDVARRQRNTNAPPHFAIFTRHGESKILKSIESQLGDTKPDAAMLENVVARLSQYHCEFVQADLASLGVETLWVDSHDDIPKVLKEIRS